jgi:hypothetical protein
MRCVWIAFIASGLVSTGSISVVVQWREEMHAWLRHIEGRLDALLDGSEVVRLGVRDDVLGNMYPACMSFALKGADPPLQPIRCIGRLRRSKSDENRFIVVIDYNVGGEHEFWKCTSPAEALAFFKACELVQGRETIDATLTPGPSDDTYTISANMPLFVSRNWPLAGMPRGLSSELTSFTVGRTLYRFAEDLR